MHFNQAIIEMNYNWNSKKILIAEDSEMNFIILRKTLESTKAEMLWAKNGEEVIELAKKNEDTDIIIMDLSMPIMDGYEATTKLRKNGCKIPIIAQSAFSEEEEQNKLDEAGFNAYISKPIKKEELLKKLNLFLQ